jgi:hypothetical protein
MLRQTMRAGSAALFTVALWALWLGLAALLVFQIYIAAVNELAVPEFLLRRVERRIADAGVRMTFARTSLDPHGRVLVENVALSLPEFAEPFVHARAIYATINPWLLIVGRVELERVRVTGATVAVPAMLSSTGRAAEVVRDLDADVRLGTRQIDIAQLSARVAGIAVTAHGAFSLPRLPAAAPNRSIAELVSTGFITGCRRLVPVLDRLDTLEDGSITLVFEPAGNRIAMVEAAVFARGFAINEPQAIEFHGLRLATRQPLVNEPLGTVQLEFEVREMRAPLLGTAHGVRAILAGQFRDGRLDFAPRDLQLTADSVEAAGLVADGISAQATPQPLPGLDARIVARLLDGPLAVAGAVNLAERRGAVQFEGSVSPRLLDFLGERLHVDVKKFFDFAALDCTDGTAQFGPGWKFEKLGARVALREIKAYHVTMDEGRATVEFDGRRFHSPDAYARIGENFARGTYEQDLRSREYRFLLSGRLRPLDISGWFHEWWPHFFQQLEFPAAPPAASVDVQGVWREGRRTSVFVFADAPKAIVRGAGFDRVRTRLFIRPSFFDGREIYGERGPGTARGSFTFTNDPVTHAWRSLDLDLVSKIDPELAIRIWGPTGEKVLGGMKFAQPPDVKLNGHFENAGPDAAPRQSATVTAKTTGAFEFHGFPLEDAAWNATIRDDEISIDDIRAHVAGGRATGNAKIHGTGDARRLALETTLTDASLGLAAAAVERFSAEANHRPPAPPGKFVQEKANVRLDLAATAEGRYADAFSFHGAGTGALRGAEIGEVPLLGQLSELLKFTALRFTSARAAFKINGRKLEFSEFALRGANSAIDAHGDYLLDRHELDFKAKLFPFQESDNLIKTVVGAVLTPISNVFEVKLTGSLQKPEWAFVIGPTNFLRSLAPGGSEPGANNPPAAPAAGTPNETAPAPAANSPAPAAPGTPPQN